MAEADNDLEERWSRLPSRWIVEGGLAKFNAGRGLGNSMAALKLLLVIVLHAENRSPRLAGATQGSATLSYDTIAGLVGLSRAMVSAGVKLLCAHGLITVRQEGRGRQNRYFLANYEHNSQWVKISNRRLFDGRDRKRIRVLDDMSCRRTADMNALKLYLLFAALRDEKFNRTRISYDKITERTGIPKGNIRKAISVLVDYGLIHVSHEQRSVGARLPNDYRLLGIGMTGIVGQLDEVSLDDDLTSG